MERHVTWPRTRHSPYLANLIASEVGSGRDRRLSGTDQLELLQGLLADREAGQSDELEGLDRKATTVLAANGVVLGLALNSSGALATSSALVYSVSIGSLLALGIGLLAGLVTLWPVSRKIVPRPGRLVQGYYAKRKSETLAVLISTRLAAFESNEGLSRTKTLRLRLQMVLLAVGGVGLVVALFCKEANL